MRVAGLVGATIYKDARRRLPFYRSDWKDGAHYSYRWMLAPATYIFFASAVPALAFGEQLSRATGGTVTGVQTLAATGICGIFQALCGGQPLLIVGVAEPIVLMYGYMYSFMQGRLSTSLFLEWSAWVCVWTAVLLLLLSVVGSCRYIVRFTRFSGELFGFLIAMLFIQQFVRGDVESFHPLEADADHGSESQEYNWRLVNGLWAVFLSFGLLYTAWELHHARTWIIGPRWFRNLLADYGVVSMVWLWTGISFSVKGTPTGTIRRLLIPNTWQYHAFWTVAGGMGRLEGKWVAGALVPAIIITILFYFDHNVSSQMAQRPEFNLRKPAAYNYDLLLLAGMTLACGLLGLPPVNGVLPQAPMHTQRLGTMRGLLTRERLLKAAQEAVGREGGSASTALSEMNAAAKKLGSEAQFKLGEPPVSDLPDPHSRADPGPSSATAELDFSASPDRLEAVLERAVPYEVAEQRWSGLIQSLLVAACLAITPLLKFIPEAVLWGYFAYMGVASLPGSQFFERMVLVFVDPQQRLAVANKWGHQYFDKVPFRVIVAFTALQFLYVGGVYGITWIHIVGSIFPVPILLLVPIRQYIMPWVFTSKYLDLMDPMGFVIEDKGAREPSDDARSPAHAEDGLSESASTSQGSPQASSNAGHATPADASQQLPRERVVSVDGQQHDQQH